MSASVPGSLEARFGDDGTLAPIEWLDAEQFRWSEQVLTATSDRFERRLAIEMSRVRQEIAHTRADILKWSFVFWLGQIGLFIALIKR